MVEVKVAVAPAFLTLTALKVFQLLSPRRSALAHVVCHIHL